MKKHLNPKNSKVIYAVIFSLYMLEFHLFAYLEGTVNGVLSKEHYITFILLNSGFIFFGASRILIKGEKARALFLIMMTVIFASATLGILFPAFLLPPSVLIYPASLSLGCLGGAIYYFAALEFHMSIHAGIILGLCTSFCYILQFIMTPLLNNRSFIVLLLILLTIANAAFIIFNPKDYILLNALPYSAETNEYKKSMQRDMIKTLSVFFLTMLLGVYMEQSWSGASNVSGVNMYGWQRLCAIPGYFFIGAFADHKRHKHMDIAIICSYAFFALGVFNSDNPGLNLAVFYFLAGVYTGYLNLAFLFLAPKTKHPEIWACLGRTLSLFEGFLGIAFYHVKRGGLIERFILAGIILCIFLLLYLGGSRNAEEGSKDGEDDEAKRFELFCERYNFTPRERDVMKLLISSDESMKNISSELKISERMLYRYMNNLYEKTGAENRSGLVKKYYM